MYAVDRIEGIDEDLKNVCSFTKIHAVLQKYSQKFVMEKIDEKMYILNTEKCMHL